MTVLPSAGSMRSFVLCVLLLACAAPAAFAQASCDTTCVDVLRVATAFATAKADEMLGPHGPRYVAETVRAVTPEADTVALDSAPMRQIASEMDLPYLDRNASDQWRQCINDATPTACRLIVGRTRIGLDYLRIRTSGRATVRALVEMITIRENGEYEAFVRSSQLEIEKLNGVWRVTGESVVVVS